MDTAAERWTRPSSVPVPTIWRRCAGTSLKFRVQDVPHHMHEDVVQFMTTHFCRDEVLCESLDFKNDPTSVREFQDLWRKMMKQDLALVALVENENGEITSPARIAGVNVTGVNYKGDEISVDMFAGRSMQVLVRDLHVYAANTVNVFELYGVEEIMTALGLCVDPQFRGQGVGLELLRARFDIGMAVGLKATMTMFSGVTAQRLAQKAGMEILAEFKYEQFKNEDGSAAYPNVKSPSLMIMGSRISSLSQHKT